MGIDGVGVFEPEEGGMFYVLLRHPSLEVLASIDQTLLLDAEFARTAADFLDRPVSARPFVSAEQSQWKRS